jgi:hypothetical protein
MRKVEFVIICGLIVGLVFESLHGEGHPHVPEHPQGLFVVQDAAGFSTSAAFH